MTITKHAAELRANGGSAFPMYLSPHSAQGQNMTGMSLRQWYAGMALMTLRDRLVELATPQSIAKYAFQVADAMLREGER